MVLLMRLKVTKMNDKLKAKIRNEMIVSDEIHEKNKIPKPKKHGRERPIGYISNYEHSLIVQHLKTKIIRKTIKGLRKLRPDVRAFQYFELRKQSGIYKDGYYTAIEDAIKICKIEGDKDEKA